MPLPTVITLVADEAYIPHVKSVMVNCRREGEWTGDFCLILPPEVDSEYFTSRGIYVLTDTEPTYFRKFALFDPYFNRQEPNIRGNPEYKWQTVLYLDADVLVQNPLEPLLHEASWGRIIADRELFTMEHAFSNWASQMESLPKNHASTMDWIHSHYDLARQQFNTGIMLWHPRTIPEDARKQLREMQQRIAPANTHVYKGTDQPVINLVFQDQLDHIRSDLFCYWQLAWKKTIVIHYCSGYAGWIAKQPGQNAYHNEKLGRITHDLYTDHLSAFEEVFPL